MKKKETVKKKVVKRTASKASVKPDTKKVRRKRINYKPRNNKKMIYLFVGLFIALLVMVACICIKTYGPKKEPSLNGSNGIKEVGAPKDKCDDGKYHPDTVK